MKPGRYPVMTKIGVDFSDLPSDLALFLSQQEETARLAQGLARVLCLPDAERQLIHQELVGSVAEAIDGYVEFATRPKAS
jgi:hypothetical protein